MDSSAGFEEGSLFADRYAVIRYVGAGAMGWVVKAKDQTLHEQEVALKILYPHLTVHAEAIRRFRAEVQITHKLLHPNIVRTYSFGSSNEGYFYVSMEYVDGSDLSQLLIDTQFSSDECVTILWSIANAMAHASRCGIVHRDLKPANIMLASGATIGATIKVADFGISHLHSSEEQASPTAMGTPRYMSPEQFHGSVVDTRSDIYSFGVLAYELCTQRPPFLGSTLFVLAEEHAESVPPSFASIGVERPRWLEELIETCLAKKREDRIQSFDEIAAFLRAHAPSLIERDEQVSHHEPSGSRESVSVPRGFWRSYPKEQQMTVLRLNRVLFVLMCVGLLLLALVPSANAKLGIAATVFVLFVMQVMLRLRGFGRAAVGTLLFVTLSVFIVRTNPATWRRVATLIFTQEMAEQRSFKRLRALFDIPFTPLEPDSIFRAILEYPNRGKEIIRALCDANVDLSKIHNSRDFSLATFAALYNEASILSHLVECGVAVNATDLRGRTMLHILTSHPRPRPDLLTPLIYGANPNMPDAEGQTPLLNSINAGRLYEARRLVVYGAKPDLLASNRASSGLHAAARLGDVAFLRLLLQKSENPNVQTADGRTALHVAAMLDSHAANKQEKLLELIRHGVAIDTRDATGKTALEYLSAEERVQLHKTLSYQRETLEGEDVAE